MTEGRTFEKLRIHNDGYLDEKENENELNTIRRKYRNLSLVITHEVALRDCEIGYHNTIDWNKKRKIHTREVALINGAFNRLGVLGKLESLKSPKGLANDFSCR